MGVIDEYLAQAKYVCVFAIRASGLSSGSSCEWHCGFVSRVDGYFLWLVVLSRADGYFTWWRPMDLRSRSLAIVQADRGQLVPQIQIDFPLSW